ncbi:metal ABC transporter substrate-binding protein [Vagococcus sp. DIV0080]|uniref:Metal ABC transporter substrate-binding protein n=2 Tax=Candidatus Vagococcus giribetii TaxID=2230876 RepID=A0ABS3HUU4_9ENTE|nr:metal ABC transporter substrate-binding protein [Vagococcus sp. DIV0080]MBO0477520.1 metal ABC transporter substrate-binding protein [Vagococcus sp. DIV0080]
MIALTACGSNNKKEATEKKDDRLQVVTTNSILENMVEEVGKDKVSIHSIVPRGKDPHEHEPLPEDISKATNADVIFFNGLNLETGGDGWFIKLMETSKKKEGKDYFVVSEGVEPMYLTGEGQESQQDPHAWLSLANGMIYVENIAKVLGEKDPENKDFYDQNAKEYVAKLDKLHQESIDKFNDVPEKKKLLVTSEGAFKYFSKAYGLEAAYIWEINTHDQGTPEQMKRIISRIKETDISSLFVEQSVDPRSMESVSRETKLPIYETIFTDSLAKKGETGDTYLSMMEWNLDKIHEGLMK